MCSEWLAANATPPAQQGAAPPTEPPTVTPLPRLSFSRVDRWEKCPLSYRFRYVDKIESESGDAAMLGKALHGAIETIELGHIQREVTAPIDRATAKAAWQAAFAEHGLVGAGVFSEGLELVLGFVRDQGELDPHDILAVEERFEIDLGGVTVVGVIDRVDRVDDETIEVIDFKTNRLLFARDDLTASLQLSLYCLAAKKLWPWAKRIQLTFWMLRHDLKQRTTRSPEQLEAASAYVQTIAGRLAKVSAYPPRPNPLCGYCEYRERCPAYAEMLEGKHEFVAQSLEDLEQVAREREQVAALAKTLYRRKDELDRILKAHLEENDALVLAGTRYSTFKVTSTDYPLDSTVAVLARETGTAESELREQLASVSNTALKRLLKGLGKAGWSSARVKLLQAELEAHATKSYAPRLWAKRVPS